MTHHTEMHIMSQADVYSLPARILHWAMALLLFSLLLAGLAMVQSLQTWHLTLLTAHKAMGVLALLLVVVRLAVRLTHTPPALPDNLSAAQKRAAHGTQVLLYVAMFAMPITGLLMQGAAGRPVSVFGLFTVPALLPVDLRTYGLLRELHGWGAWGLIALVLLHITAALHHGLVKRDKVLRSML